VALTVKRVAKALRSATPGRHFDGQGLYLVVSGKKAAHWERRYELNHKPHWLGLGSARTFTLEEARERNRAVSKLLADGIDPLQQRRIERAARTAATAKMRTFQEAAEEYIQRHQSRRPVAHLAALRLPENRQARRSRHRQGFGAQRARAADRRRCETR
jgi:hypothetical protein